MLVERDNRGELRRGCGRCGRHGQRLLDVEEARVEHVALNERDGERLWGVAEERVTFLPKT